MILQRAAAIVRREVDADVILLVIAVVLIAVGFWDWWRPGAWIVPGAVLLWIALPSRRRFVAPEPDGPAKHGSNRLGQDAGCGAHHRGRIRPKAVRYPAARRMRW